MSWQDYVDNQLLASQCVSKAAIAGHDGGVWAKSEGFELLHHQTACVVCLFKEEKLPLKMGTMNETMGSAEAEQVSKEEVAKIVQGFDKTELLTSGGVTLAGQRYIYLSGTDRVIRAKLGKTGVHCMKTQQVSIYEEPVQPQQAASIVEKLGDYLITCGY
uniref:Profilin n=2 Tax=Cellia TaxID=44534 RepID=A0A182QJ13_9DIPT